jgi:hypothetical protein
VRRTKAASLAASNAVLFVGSVGLMAGSYFQPVCLPVLVVGAVVRASWCRTAPIRKGASGKQLTPALARTRIAQASAMSPAVLPLPRPLSVAARVQAIETTTPAAVECCIDMGDCAPGPSVTPVTTPKKAVLARVPLAEKACNAAREAAPSTPKRREKKDKKDKKDKKGGKSSPTPAKKAASVEEACEGKRSASYRRRQRKQKAAAEAKAAAGAKTMRA